eukprot:TRINITY_DN12304_c0_g1_i5.p1 TRINITY_DN12304_c0_g1~~TRINITY_DN12304_c0_g1_i5.p1  ORF type:complete len:207 (+),score=37.86 TRINITY_DN12304_c0_g1_i5:750-1370(+)
MSEMGTWCTSWCLMMGASSRFVAAGISLLTSSILKNGCLVTVENKVKGGAYASFWELPLTLEHDKSVLHPKFSRKVSDGALTSFSTNSNGTELAIGMANGVVKRIGIEEFSEIDWAKETDLRVSYVAHIEEKDDLILGIVSDGRYAITKLDGEQKDKQSSALSSSALFVGSEKKAARATCKKLAKILVALIIVLGAIVCAIHFIFH